MWPALTNYHTMLISGHNLSPPTSARQRKCDGGHGGCGKKVLVLMLDIDEPRRLDRMIQTLGSRRGVDRKRPLWLAFSSCQPQKPQPTRAGCERVSVAADVLGSQLVALSGNLS